MTLDKLQWAENWQKGLFFFAVVLFLVLLANYFSGLTSYIFHLRVPLLFALIIIVFPLFAASKYGQSMFRNMFVQTHWQQLTLIAVSVIFVSMAVVLAFDSILKSAPQRFGLNEVSSISSVSQVTTVLLLSTPHIWVAYKFSKKSTNAILGIAVGLALGLLLIAILMSFYQSDALAHFVEPVGLMLLENQPGFTTIDANGDKSLMTNHVNVTAFAAISLFIYIPLGMKLKPWLRTDKMQIPGILYLNIIATSACLLFAGATFYFDYFHIPVFIGFLIFSVASYSFFKVDHFYEILPLKNTNPATASADFEQILKTRLSHQQHNDKTMVVVCCSGGGIQASAWAAKVLTGLEEELGQSFSQAVTLVSSVSGGSVGSLFYLDRFTQQGIIAPNEYPAIFDGATTDVMNGVGWGLAYPDLLRLVGFPWLPPKMMDRGTVIEEEWKTSLKESNEDNPEYPLFSNWRQKIINGSLPIPAINATIVESGKRFIISPVSFEHPENQQCEDFACIYQGVDINAVSAARMSATFPFVSPIARNTSLKGLPDYHIADGGYFDNYGVFTAMEWLRNHVSPLKTQNKLDLKNILFIEIHAFAEKKPNTRTKKKEKSGLKAAVIGPGMVLANARSSTQTARNKMEVQVMKEQLLTKGINLESFVIKFPAMNSPYHADKEYKPPLSWKLSDEEKETVQLAWQKMLKQTNSPVHLIKRLWQTEWEV